MRSFFVYFSTKEKDKDIRLSVYAVSKEEAAIKGLEKLKSLIHYTGDMEIIRVKEYWVTGGIFREED